MAEPFLEVRELSVDRDGRRILHPFSFEVRPGTVLAILGPNGAGKSTLLKALCGLLPHAGTIQFGGQQLARLDRRERARRIAYVPQHSALEAPLAVREVVAQGRYSHRSGLGRLSAEDEQAIDRALEVTGSAQLGDRPFSRLSYGERRLVLLARALATGAKVMLFDEPTAALDVAHALSLLEMLRRLADHGACVLVVLHHLQEAVSVCNEALLLSEGCCIAQGPTAEVISADPIRRVYDVELVPGAQFGYRRLSGTKPAP
jgi:iron complex transport system ATP-binding protein